MTKYNPNDPTVYVFERFDECREVARAVKTPFTELQLIQKFNILIEQTGVYNEQLTEWEGKPENNKTWANCQVYWLENT